VIVPPVPLKLFPEPSTYTPVPVPEAIIFPVFFPELLPAPAIYIPRLFPAVIVFVFSTEAVFPDLASDTIPTIEPDALLSVIVPELIPFPSSA